ncbi:threonyl-tRNA synthetase [Hydrogenispora ethanolica]|uniref:Threonine--tRNA ligase n=1 Tax=Hydrogenispora ethanolica TaxID=1082276 RepID=A0A4R1SBX2_HYDET|nr:threonine--tRNA ligase [Hydrogenispora ethanolica]TCL76520.1 threonyl-tRNA synthetase [Hydrogenispora ethanolica]
MKVIFPDQSSREYPDGTTPRAIAESISGRLAKEVIAAQVDDTLVDLSQPLDGEVHLKLIKPEDPEGLEVLRHSASHIMAQAVRRIFPDAKLAIGPAIENGFYYDFDLPEPLKLEDLARIEAEMAKIVAADLPFERYELSKGEALERFRAAGEKYKAELVEGLEDGTISFYRQGDFDDLCRGPHLPSTGRLKAYKLMSIAGAYWRGDSSREMLQRIYGVAFATKAGLEEYLKFLEEAARRDHRKLGKELDLFSIDDQIGGGLVLWHPKGARVRQEIEQFWKEEHYKNGYELVYTPHVGRSTLWETSGHLGFYSENMYAPMDIEGQQYYAKPMNCPFHIAIYKSRGRSYRELPFRWAELGTVYRYEKSGVLHGLMRVRGFTQDDAHIFCRPDQMPEEIERTLNFCLKLIRSFGFNDFKLYLATKPADSVGEPERWEAATAALQAAIDKVGLPSEIDEGGGAFYGPKIDLKIKDALGREWQCSTIQFDFNMSERFGLTYKGSDGADHRPYMIHRALLGSIERFFGVLLEHYEGAFPTWLAPVQAMVLPVTPDYLEYARTVMEDLRKVGIRAELDSRNEKIGYRIREVRLQKIPYWLVVGEREAREGVVAVSSRKEGDLGSQKVDWLKERLQKEIAAHS